MQNLFPHITSASKQCSKGHCQQHSARENHYVDKGPEVNPQSVRILTCLCRSCRCVLCLELRGRQGLDHKAMNIWTIKLEEREIKNIALVYMKIKCG